MPRKSLMLTASVLALGAGLCAGFVVRPAVASKPTTLRADTQRFATIDTFKLIRLMIDTPESAAIVEAFNNETEGLLEPIRNRYTELQGLTTTDAANAEQYQAQMQQLVSQFQELQQGRQNDLRQLQARIALDAHQKIKAEVETLAASRGYSHVVSAPVGPSPEGLDLAAQAEDRFARLFFIAPMQDDLTQAVMDALNLKEPAPGETPPAGPGLPGAGGGEDAEDGGN